MSTRDFQDVRSLFHRALEVPSTERNEWLARECAGREALRSEIQSLLDADAGTEDGLRPEDGSIAQRLLSAGENATPDPIEIGPFRIIRRIGQGGMGVVFLATQSQPQREVALKVLRAGPGAEGLRRRFEREVRLLGRLEHPGIARIYEAGVADTPVGSVPYFAMEYVDGVPITEFARARGLDDRARIELMISICEAVQHAHQKGVLHRDLKPDNILVQAPAESASTVTSAGAIKLIGAPKILDFGVARLLESGQDSIEYTQTGMVIGTVAYMSPEQAGGDPDSVDTRGDVYSLAVILYELLTGVGPLDVRGRPLSEAVRIIREIDPPPLRAAPGRPARRFDPDLETIVAKALDKERDRRYASAAELGADLRRFLADEPLLAHPPGSLYLLKKFSRRHRGAIAAAIAITVLLIGGIVGTSIGLAQAIEARDDARENLVIAEKQRRRAEAINELMTTSLQGFDPVQGGRQDLLVGDAMLQVVGEIKAGALSDDLSTKGTLLRTIAIILVGNSRPAEALPLAQEALDIARQLHPGDHADVAAAWTCVGAALNTLGRGRESEEAYSNALDMLLRLHPGDDAGVVRALGNKGLSLQQRRQFDQAHDHFKRALDMARRLSPPDPRAVARGLNNMGGMHMAFNQPAEAEPYFREVLDVHRSLFQGDHPLVALALNNLAQSLNAQRRWNDAEPLLEEALTMKNRIFKTDHIEVMRGYNNLADVKTSLGHIDEAEQMYEKSLDMARRHFPADHAFVALALNNLAWIRVELGAPQEAEPLYKESLAMTRRLFAGDHPDLAIRSANYALCLDALGRDDEALALAGEAVAIADRILPSEHPVRRGCADILNRIREK